MGVKWKTEKDGMDDMAKAVKVLNRKKVKVGVLEGEHQWLAAIHEYGCHIPVTPKMRAFLHYKGIHLKATTTEIVIPERSFIRAGHDKYQDEVLSKAEKILPDVLVGTMSVNQYCETVGLLLSDKIKDYATDLKDPPNSSMTTEQKGSSNPLIDTGDMVGGITYKVE